MATLAMSAALCACTMSKEENTTNGIEGTTVFEEPSEAVSDTLNGWEHDSMEVVTDASENFVQEVVTVCLRSE